MAQVRVTLPRVSEATDDFYVVEWLVTVGERVEAGQALVRVETDKAMVDVPSPFGGTLTEQLVLIDAEVSTGAEIAIIDTE